MKVKGIELMKMIVDGKIKKDTKFGVLNKRGMTYTVNATIDDVTMRELLDLDFEILEDKTEEIEEIQRSDSYVDQINNNRNKINELVRAYNSLIKQDTSKETNCMTD